MTASQAVNGLISLCESNKLGAVFCHGHSTGLHYSPSDDFGELRLAKTIRQFIPPSAPIASLLFTAAGMTGRIWLPGKNRPTQLSEIVVLGRSIRTFPIQAKPNKGQDGYQIYDRQVRAFGVDGQKAISNAKVGIVGVGGTGSAVIEQLARLGTKDFVIVDHDVFEPTNLSRIYGSFAGLGMRKAQLKVGISKDHIRRINPDARVLAIPKSVVYQDAAIHLLDRDVIFLCTDEHWGRSVVNQICYQYLIPVINLGVRVDTQKGLITSAIGGVDVLSPDKPCLWCKQFLDPDRIAAESMPGDRRRELLREGYVQDVDAKAPSVISFTSTMASIAVSQFLQLMTDFMGAGGDVYRLYHDFLDGTTRRGTTTVMQGCVCQKVRAYGDLANLDIL